MNDAISTAKVSSWTGTLLFGCLGVRGNTRIPGACEPRRALLSIQHTPRSTLHTPHSRTHEKKRHPYEIETRVDNPIGRANSVRRACHKASCVQYRECSKIGTLPHVIAHINSTTLAANAAGLALVAVDRIQRVLPDIFSHAPDRLDSGFVFAWLSMSYGRLGRTTEGGGGGGEPFAAKDLTCAEV